MKTLNKGMLFSLLLTLSLSGLAQNYQEIPEFIFKNAQLVSGTSNQDGTVYRFNNIAAGYDATVTILGRSSSQVILDTIDIPAVGNMGFDKALQPQLGIRGNVPANSNWWMKFQLNFLQAGTNNPAQIDKFTATAIDIDGDGESIQENLLMYKATTASYCPITYLTQSKPALTTCPLDGKASLPKTCTDCNGLGYLVNGGGKKKKCKTCNGTGLLFSACDDPWTGQDIFVQGPIENQAGIDTLATTNMATFTYNNVTSFTFQYGAKSGQIISNAGERLNSMWFKAFSLVVPKTLPVKMQSFTAILDKKNVDLNWSTAFEEEFSHFVLERSTDGKNFSDIAIFFGNSTNSGHETYYSYKDPNVTSSTNVVFYRIRLVEKSNEPTYSAIRVIRLGKEQEALQLTTYPNPVKDQLHITLPAAWQGKSIVLELYTDNGIKVQGVQINNASQTENINTGNLPRGFYLVKAMCGNEVSQQRIVKN